MTKEGLPPRRPRAQHFEKPETIVELVDGERYVIREDAEWVSFILNNAGITITGKAQGLDGENVVRDLLTFPVPRVLSVRTQRARQPIDKK